LSLWLAVERKKCRAEKMRKRACSQLGQTKVGYVSELGKYRRKVSVLDLVDRARQIRSRAQLRLIETHVDQPSEQLHCLISSVCFVTLRRIGGQ